MYSRGLDEHGENTLYAYADSNFESPKSTGGRQVHMNGAITSASAQRHSTVDTSTTGAELTECFKCALAANPFRPIFNPYMQRPLYQNKRYVKQRKNKNKHRNKQNKFTYKRPNEQEQLQAPKRIKRSMEEEKLKGKRPIDETEGHTQYNTPTKKSKTTSQTHSAEDHKKNNQENKRKRGATKKTATDKLFSIITNKVIIMLKYKGTKALDELVQTPAL